MENGYLKLGRIGGAPIRIHWTAPLVVVFLGFLLNGFRFAPATWLAILLLILIHEMGHAILVRAFGLGLLSVDVKGIGGTCSWYGSPTPIRRALIAWGGVLAQAVVLVIALPARYLVPSSTPMFVVEMLLAFTYSNLYLMVFNLLPIPGFDGAEAWKLVGKDGLPAWWRKRAIKKGKQKRRDQALLGLIVRHLSTGLSDASLWQPVDEAGAQMAPLEERARRIAQSYERVGPDLALVDATGREGPYDRTLLLLLGQERARTAVVIDGDSVTFAARFDSGINFLSLFGISGGMPTVISLKKSFLPGALEKLGLPDADVRRWAPRD